MWWGNIAYQFSQGPITRKGHVYYHTIIDIQIFMNYARNIYNFVDSCLRGTAHFKSAGSSVQTAGCSTLMSHFYLYFGAPMHRELSQYLTTDRTPDVNPVFA